MKKLLLACAAIAACTAFADRITLKSGTVVTGTVLGTEGGVIKFKSDDFGTIDIKPDAVATLADAEAKPVEVAAIAPVPKPPETWHGSINVGYQCDRGNTEADALSIVANVNRRWEKDRFKGDFGYHYTSTGTSTEDKKKTKDKLELEVQHDHFWLPKFYTYENGRYERDVIQDLDGRFRIGVGLGYQWLEKRAFEATGIWSFNQELGAAYAYDKYGDPDPDRNDSYATFRYAHHLKWEPKWTKGFEFFHDFEYLPEADDFAIAILKGNVGFSTMLFWHIDLLVKFEWEYNSKPASKREKNDYRTIVGLGYKW